MKLSIIIPTYNNGNVIGECLKSIRAQSVSPKEYEVLIIDGGSTDNTRAIATHYGATLLHNPHRVEDKARVLALEQAKGEIICLIDADNILPDKKWMYKMLLPFKDKEIECADSLFFSARKTDPIKVRYQALIGGDDPIATYLGFYSRWCYFKDDWTDFPYIKEERKGYWKIWLQDPELIPSIGSNGFCARREIFDTFFKKSYLHPDYIYDMARAGKVCIAKVDTSVIHNQPTFFKNKVRRIKRRMRGEVTINYHYGITKLKLFLLLARICLVLPLTYDVIKGYIRKPDRAWLFHYPASFGLVAIYGYYKILEVLKIKV